MSKEFFDAMETINIIVNRIKFLEGSHPELKTKYYERAVTVLSKLKTMQDDIYSELEKKAMTKTPKKTKKIK